MAGDAGRGRKEASKCYSLQFKVTEPSYDLFLPQETVKHRHCMFASKLGRSSIRDDLSFLPSPSNSAVVKKPCSSNCLLSLTRAQLTASANQRVPKG